MRDSVEGSSSGGGRSLAESDSSPVPYRPPYHVNTYLQDYRSCFGTVPVLMLLPDGAALFAPFWCGVRDTAPGARRKRSEYGEVALPSTDRSPAGRLALRTCGIRSEMIIRISWLFC